MKGKKNIYTIHLIEVLEEEQRRSKEDYLLLEIMIKNFLQIMRGTVHRLKKNKFHTYIFSYIHSYISKNICDEQIKLKK